MLSRFSHAFAAPRPGLPRRAWFPAVLLLGLVAVQHTVLQLLQYEVLTRPPDDRLTGPSLADVLASYGPLPLLMVLFGVVTGAALRVVRPRYRPAAYVAAATVGAVLAAAALAALMPWWTTGWLTLETFGWVRRDLLLLVLIGLAFVLLLARARRRYGLVFSALVGVSVVLAWLSAFEFGYFRATGTPGSWSLLPYFVRHAGAMLPLVAGEARGLSLVLLLLPLGVVPVLALLYRVRCCRAWLHGPVDTSGRVRHALAAALPLLVVCLAAPGTPPAPVRLGYVNLLADVAEALTAPPAAYAAAPPRPTFDAVDLRLAPTDRLRTPNVVFIILESARPRSLTPYDSTIETTPFLANLARRSLVVERLYSVVGHTNKALPPILAGVPPHLGLDTPESDPGGLPARGLPDLLRPLGYRSAFFTSATNDYEDRTVLLQNLGFDVVHGAETLPTEGVWRKEAFGYDDRMAHDPMLDWIDQALDAETPFFLTYLTLAGHHPYDLPPDAERRAFADDDKLDAYLNSLHWIDGQLERLFAAFEARGLFESTVFVLVGDHGQALGEHGTQGHNTVWDEVLHVPGLLFAPSRWPEGGRIEGLRQQTDLLPTVADLVGAELTGGTLPGRSLLTPPDPERTLFHSKWNGDAGLAAQRGTLKFVYHNGQRPTQVFDLRRDPLERLDVAATVSPSLIEAVDLELVLWRQSVNRQYAQQAARAAGAGR